jgi:hypothetical protein
MPSHEIRDDEKVEAYQGEIDHVEANAAYKHDAQDNALARGQVESGYEGLTIWQTIKHFKIACLVCGLATFAASTDGYQSRAFNTVWSLT